MIHEKPRTGYEYQVRNETRRKLTEAVALIQDASLGDLEKMLDGSEDSKHHPVLLLAVASAFVRASMSGDFALIDKIYDRVIGKSRRMAEDTSLVPQIRSLPVRSFAKSMGLVDRSEEEEKSEKSN